MSGPQQAKVLLATLAERASARGNVYLRGWAGASKLGRFPRRGRRRGPADMEPLLGRAAAPRRCPGARPGLAGARGSVGTGD